MELAIADTGSSLKLIATSASASDLFGLTLPTSTPETSPPPEFKLSPKVRSNLAAIPYLGDMIAVIAGTLLTRGVRTFQHDRTDRENARMRVKPFYDFAEGIANNLPETPHSPLMDLKFDANYFANFYRQDRGYIADLGRPDTTLILARSFLDSLADQLEKGPNKEQIWAAVQQTLRDKFGEQALFDKAGKKKDPAEFVARLRDGSQAMSRSLEAYQKKREWVLPSSTADALSIHDEGEDAMIRNAVTTVAIPLKLAGRLQLMWERSGYIESQAGMENAQAWVDFFYGKDREKTGTEAPQSTTDPTSAAATAQSDKFVYPEGLQSVCSMPTYAWADRHLTSTLPQEPAHPWVTADIAGNVGMVVAVKAMMNVLRPAMTARKAGLVVGAIVGVGGALEVFDPHDCSQEQPSIPSQPDPSQMRVSSATSPPAIPPSSNVVDLPSGIMSNDTWQSVLKTLPAEAEEGPTQPVGRQSSSSPKPAYTPG